MRMYKFQAEDLRVLGNLGRGAFGTVEKMLFTKTDTQMALKVSVIPRILFVNGWESHDAVLCSLLENSSACFRDF